MKLDAGDVDLEKIREAAELIDAGGLVAFPTETVYGIACRVESEALARLDNLNSEFESPSLFPRFLFSSNLHYEPQIHAFHNFFHFFFIFLQFFHQHLALANAISYI